MYQLDVDTRAASFFDLIVAINDWLLWVESRLARFRPGADVRVFRNVNI